MKKHLSFCCLGALVLATIATARQDDEPHLGDENSETEQSLPDGAVWRFGLYGDDSDSNGIYRLVYSPDGKYLATRNRNNLVSIYEVATRKQLCEVEPNEQWVLAVDFSPDSKFFLTAAVGTDEKVKIWSTQTGKLQSELDRDATVAFFSGSGEIKSLSGQKVVTYSWPGANKIDEKKWAQDGDQPLTMSRDGRLVVSYRPIPPAGNRIYQVQVTDLEDPKSKVILAGPTSIPRAIVISENNHWLAAAYNRFRKIQVWDLRDPHEKKFSLEHKQRVQSVAISNDNRFLLSTSWDTTATVWDVLTLDSIARLEGHTEHVNASAFSPVDFQVATGASGSTDSSAIVWDLKPILFPHPAKSIAPDDFEDVWKKLGSADARAALDAINSLVHASDKLLARIGPAVGAHNQSASQEAIEKWIGQLNSPIFKLRSEATNQLLEARGPAEILLQKALAEAESAEILYRITKILRHPITRPKISDEELRRLYRAVFALELIGNDEAIKLLENIAISHAHIDIARDAAAALERLKLAQGL